jgi:hypothetical protein
MPDKKASTILMEVRSDRNRPEPRPPNTYVQIRSEQFLTDYCGRIGVNGSHIAAQGRLMKRDKLDVASIMQFAIQLPCPRSSH